MIFEINHPLVKVKLSRMRNKDTDSRDFRFNLEELSQLLCYEVTKDYKTVKFPITTPVAKTDGHKLANNIVLVPILRAGLGMVDGFKNMIPAAPIGHVGVYRDEKTLKAVEYYCKMPTSIKGADVIIVDPMLATGHSAVAAIDLVKAYKPKSIKYACILAAPEGLKLVQKMHKDVNIYTTSIDSKLNDKGYIVPGLGDAGDRIFGTK